METGNKLNLLIPLLIRYFSKVNVHLTKNNKWLYNTKNIHKGKRCFIVGNGPSLQVHDLDKLKNEITFASNKIYLSFKQTEWRPTYYGAEDILFIRNNYDDIKNLNGFTKFFPHFFLKYFSRFDDAIYYFALPYNNYPKPPRFSHNVMDKVYGSNTVTYRLIQLATFMGIREIYLIGVDFDYKTPKSPIGHLGGYDVYQSEGERNHFHPDYIKTGEKWMEPNLKRHKKAYQAADNAVKKVSGQIFNATRGGKLEIFPRINFDKLF